MEDFGSRGATSPPRDKLGVDEQQTNQGPTFTDVSTSGTKRIANMRSAAHSVVQIFLEARLNFAPLIRQIHRDRDTDLFY